MTNEDRVAAYVQTFETLQLDSVKNLREHVSDDVHFRDPFNNTYGAEKYLAIWRHTFEIMQEPNFSITRWSMAGKTAYIHWHFAFKYNGKPMAFEGLTEVELNDEGYICMHVDHYDAASQLHAKIPVVGILMRWLGNKFAT